MAEVDKTKHKLVVLHRAFVTQLVAVAYGWPSGRLTRELYHLPLRCDPLEGYCSAKEMDGAALRILRRVAKRYDVTLEQALAMASKKYGDYRDQYPLALLIEGEYLGVTLNHTPPQGAEKMREYSHAMMLQDMALKKRPDGSATPASVYFDGSREHVFVKAKGALYLDEIKRKRWDRFFSFLVGVLVGLSTLTFKAWLDKAPNRTVPSVTVGAPSSARPVP